MLYEWNNSAQEWVKVQRWNNSARKWESDGRREKTLSFDCPHCDRPCTGESEEEVYMDFRKHIMYMKDCNCYCKHKTEVIPKWLAELDSAQMRPVLSGEPDNEWMVPAKYRRKHLRGTRNCAILRCKANPYLI